MKTVTTVQIDGEKLRTVIKANKMSGYDFSQSIGHDKTFINKVIKRGVLSLSDYLLIKSMYGVDIKLEEAPQVEEKKEESSVDTDAILLAIEDSTKQIVARIDTLIATINRTGNVQMQILEELHKTNSHLLKNNTNTYNNPYVKKR